MDGPTTVSIQADQPCGPLRTPQPDAPDNGDETPKQRNRLTEEPLRSPTKSGPGWAKAEWEHRRAAAPGRCGCRGDAFLTRPRRLPRPAPGLPAWETPAWKNLPPNHFRPKEPRPKHPHPNNPTDCGGSEGENHKPHHSSRGKQITSLQRHEQTNLFRAIPRHYGSSVALSATSGQSLNYPITTVAAS